jgi:prolyl-tRNA synthetase
VLAETGESQVFCHRDFEAFAVPGADMNYDDDAAVAAVVEKWTTPFAATDEIMDKEDWAREAWDGLDEERARLRPRH